MGVSKINILKKIAITTRKSIKLIVLMFLSIIILLALVVLFYDPTYEVSLNGEVIGFTSDKSSLQERINEYTSGDEDENIAFIQIDAMPTYRLCLLKKDVETNDDEIFAKVTEDGTVYYKYYAITDDKQEKYYVSTFQEAEEIIEELEEKDSANQDDLGIVEKYDKTIKEFTSVSTCVAELYEEETSDSTSNTTSSSSSTSTSTVYSTSASSSYVSLGISLINPISGTITSRYGSNDSVRTSSHSGIDIAASSGTSIKAAASGTVTFSGWSGGYGYVVKLDHGNGVVTIYAHCSSLLVSAGETVSQGEVIARVGSTGNSTGPHLHFEVRKNGVTYNPQNYVY